MDPNSGRFVEEQYAESWMQRIEIGETIKIKGEECEVTAIGDRHITLRLLSADERMAKAFGGSLVTDMDSLNRHERRERAALARKREKK